MICAIHTADRPLVVQFAASNADDFGMAAEMVAPYADAVDLNCGCPQRSVGQPLLLEGGGGGGEGGEGRGAVDLNCGCPQRSAGQPLPLREAVREGGRGGEGMRWT